MSFLFCNDGQTCRFTLVGYGSQPTGYFTINGETKYFKGIDAKEETIWVDFADKFMGTTKGTDMLRMAPAHVRTVFLNYIPVLESYIPDKISP